RLCITSRSSGRAASTLHVRAAPSLDAQAVCRARHLYRANLEAFSGRRVPHEFTLVRSGAAEHEGDVVVVHDDDFGNELEVWERCGEVTPVPDDAVESRSLAIGGIMVDDILSEELAEPLELVRGHDLRGPSECRNVLIRRHGC